MGATSVSHVPDVLRLVHVRLPPVSQFSQSGVSANAVEFQLASLTVHTADCSSDVFLASHTASNDVDQLVCTALDVGAIAKNATIVSVAISYSVCSIFVLTSILTTFRMLQ
jgi:hypothetical protein